MAYYDYWKPYVPVAERKKLVEQEIVKRRKKGEHLNPIVILGRSIATTFWGKAWCNHLETYSDYENRLPRGRTYVRNGSVIDLQITPGKVKALVQGTSLYRLNIDIEPIVSTHWEQIVTTCAGQIHSLVELLSGRFSDHVMSNLIENGLFPKVKQISMDCSCPDWATMCKHVAAVLYGIGARLDQEPSLLFTLRQVDPSVLIGKASVAALLNTNVEADALQEEDLSELFGIDMEQTPKTKLKAQAKSSENSNQVKSSRKPALAKPTKPSPIKAKEQSKAKTEKNKKRAISNQTENRNRKNKVVEMTKRTKGKIELAPAKKSPKVQSATKSTKTSRAASLKATMKKETSLQVRQTTTKKEIPKKMATLSKK